jgi:hypothetical protein
VPERGPQVLVLAHRVGPPARERVQPHKADVPLLEQRVGGDEEGHGPERARDVAAALEQRRLLLEEREELDTQLVARPDSPVLVAVVGQEALAVERDRLRVELEVGAAARAVGRRTELLDVDADPVRGERDELARRLDEGLARARLGQPPGVVERLAQVRGGRRRRELGPERFHHLLAVEPVPRREREQLHHRCGLALPPRLLRDRPAVHRDPEAAEKADTDVGHTAARIVVRSAGAERAGRRQGGAVRPAPVSEP